MSSIDFTIYDKMSPFEIKDAMIHYAKASSQKSAAALLNAGRGNPNWIATRPREAFFLFGQFALAEARRTMDNPTAGVAGMPQKPGVAARLASWLAMNGDAPGAKFLSDAVDYVVKTFKFDADAFVYEMTDSIIGDNYPVPDRMLVHNEAITHEYLQWAMCGNPRPAGTFDLFAVEGGTAAMCYIFKTLKANRLLKAGDTIALGTPIFTPYLEMPLLEDYGLNVVSIGAPQENRFQFTDVELKKLEDPTVKAFFLVNPGNPTAMAISPETMQKIVDLVSTKRPDLILLTDDVYGTFVKDFRSLLGALPRNTIGVYSYSKYFGCTGWRLGVVAVHQDNIFDEKLAALPETDKAALDTRYGSLTLHPREMRFIDRMVADSRDVALNHTAGLSLPQQVMMSIFSIAELMDAEKKYQDACMAIVHRRAHAMVEGLGIEVQPNPLFDGYYGLIDFEFWIRRYLSEEVVQYVKTHIHPLDIVFRLAEDHGIVLLNGGGFHAPDWSARVSFANLPDEVYLTIGRAVRAIARGYYDAYLAAGGKPPEPA